MVAEVLDVAPGGGGDACALPGGLRYPGLVVNRDSAIDFAIRILSWRAVAQRCKVTPIDAMPSHGGNVGDVSIPLAIRYGGVSNILLIVFSHVGTGFHLLYHIIIV